MKIISNFYAGFVQKMLTIMITVNSGLICNNLNYLDYRYLQNSDESSYYIEYCSTIFSFKSFSLTSNSFLLLILKPNRITSHSNTLFDNIFSNVIDPNIISGNLTVTISDHLQYLRQ